MSKAVTMYLRPVGGQQISRTSKDSARMAAYVELAGTTDRPLTPETAGTLIVRCEVSKYGVISVDASEADASYQRHEASLFYAQLAIDRSAPSGVRIRRETEPPARPDGCLNLTADQVETIRAAFATIDNTNITALQSERAAFYGALDTIRALLPATLDTLPQCE